jgi:hypothetical protein
MAYPLHAMQSVQLNVPWIEDFILVTNKIHADP